MKEDNTHALDAFLKPQFDPVADSLMDWAQRKRPSQRGKSGKRLNYLDDLKTVTAVLTAID